MWKSAICNYRLTLHRFLFCFFLSFCHRLSLSSKHTDPDTKIDLHHRCFYLSPTNFSLNSTSMYNAFEGYWIGFFPLLLFLVCTVLHNLLPSSQSSLSKNALLPLLTFQFNLLSLKFFFSFFILNHYLHFLHRQLVHIYVYFCSFSNIIFAELTFSWKPHLWEEQIWLACALSTFLSRSSLCDNHISFAEQIFGIVIKVLKYSFHVAGRNTLLFCFQGTLY